MTEGSIRGGKGRGGLTRRSSNFAISFVFQSSLWTCHDPSTKAVMGIKARTVMPSLLCFFFVEMIWGGASTIETKSGSSAFVPDLGFVLMSRRACLVPCWHREVRRDGRVTENIAFRRRDFVPLIAGCESDKLFHGGIATVMPSPTMSMICRHPPRHQPPI